MRVPFNSRSAPNDATGNGTNAPLYKSLQRPVSGGPLTMAAAFVSCFSCPSSFSSKQSLVEATPPSASSTAMFSEAFLLSEEFGLDVEIISSRSPFPIVPVVTGRWRLGSVDGAMGRDTRLFLWWASHSGRSMVTFRRSVRALCTYCSVTYSRDILRGRSTGLSTWCRDCSLDSTRCVFRLLTHRRVYWIPPKLIRHRRLTRIFHVLAHRGHAKAYYSLPTFVKSNCTAAAVETAFFL